MGKACVPVSFRIYVIGVEQHRICRSGFSRINQLMKVNFKLYASLGQYLPAGAEDHQIALDVAEGMSPAQLLELQGVPRAEVHLVLVNGVFIPPSQRDNPLMEGDQLAVWPAVAGG